MFLKNIILQDMEQEQAQAPDGELQQGIALKLHKGTFCKLEQQLASSLQYAD